MKNIDIKSFLIGLLSCASLIFLMGQTNNVKDEYYFNTIRAGKIVLENEESKITITSSGLAIQSIRENKEKITYLASFGLHITEDEKYVSALTGNTLTAYNDDGKSVLKIGAGDSGGAALSMHNPDGEQHLWLASSDSTGGALSLHNKNGKPIAYMGADNKKDDGLIILQDHNGDKGFAASGKQ